MKKIYFTVGPSQIYPNLPIYIKMVLKENILSISHRGTDFKELFEDTVICLKKLLNIPNNYQIFFVSSALEAMERTIQGCVEKTSFHIITGSFGKAWANYAQNLGKEVLKHEVKINEESSISNVAIPDEAELICITQNDTSTGFWVSPEEIYKLKKKYPEKMIAIDVVSSVPYVNIDYKYIDIAFFSVQKGFGLPAGLGVMIINPKILEKTEKLLKKNLTVGSYHNLKILSEKAKEFQTPETPNVLNIYLLNKVARDMLKTGIRKIRKETDQKAKMIYSFFDKHKKYQPFIKNTQLRSPTTPVIDVSNESEKLRKKIAKHGFIIGAGYGIHKLNQIRIANFQAHKLKVIKSVLKLI